MDGEQGEGRGQVWNAMVQGLISAYLSLLAVAENRVQIWEYFLAYSTIVARQGSATCYQITMVKNLNSTHRVEGIPSQFGLQGALAASKIDRTAHKARDVAGGLGEKVKNILRPDSE